MSTTLSRRGEAAHGSLLRAAARRLSRATARLGAAKRQAARARVQLHYWKRARSKILAGIRGSGVALMPGGSLTYERWAKALLSSIGAAPCRSDMEAVVAWETAESTGARYNPLATTRAEPGSYSSAHSNVQNFISLSQGIAATRTTLLNGPSYFGYSSVVEDLLTCAPAWATVSAIHGSYWCRGCSGGRYVVDQLASVAQRWGAHASRRIGG